jgi:hypothetical protein
MMEMQTQKMLDKGLPEDAVEQAMGFISKFYKPGILAAGGLGGSLVFGSILSLIVGAIMKRDESPDLPLTEEEGSSAD